MTRGRWVQLACAFVNGAVISEVRDRGLRGWTLPWLTAMLVAGACITVAARWGGEGRR